VGDEKLAGISAKAVKALRDETGAGMMDCKKALSDAEGEMEKARKLLRERGLSKAGKRAGRETSEGAIGISFEGGQGVIIELGSETDFVAKNDQFQSLVQEVADAVRAAGATDLESALAAKLGEGSVDDRVKAVVGLVGENIQLKRAAALNTEGVVSGYIHGGGKLGVIIAVKTDDAGKSAEAARDVAMHVAAADPTPLAVDRDGLDQAVVKKEEEILRNQALQSGKPENIVENIVKGRINKFYAEHCLVEQAFVKDPDKKVGEVLSEAGGASVIAFLRFKLGEVAE
jgi:elongation factor Ts